MTSRPMTAMTVSFITSTPRSHQIAGNRVSRQIKAAVWVSLSAIGSSTLPRSLTIWKRRAMKPSAISVAPESSSTQAARG